MGKIRDVLWRAEKAFIIPPIVQFLDDIEKDLKEEIMTKFQNIFEGIEIEEVMEGDFSPGFKEKLRQYNIKFPENGEKHGKTLKKVEELIKFAEGMVGGSVW